MQNFCQWCDKRISWSQIKIQIETSLFNLNLSTSVWLTDIQGSFWVCVSQWETMLHVTSSLIGWAHTQNDPWHICMSTLDWHKQKLESPVDRIPSQHKNCLSRYWNSYYQDQMVVRPSYLYNENTSVDKIDFWYWNSSQTVIKTGL